MWRSPIVTAVAGVGSVMLVALGVAAFVSLRWHDVFFVRSVLYTGALVAGFFPLGFQIWFANDVASRIVRKPSRPAPAGSTFKLLLTMAALFGLTAASAECAYVVGLPSSWAASRFIAEMTHRRLEDLSPESRRAAFITGATTAGYSGILLLGVLLARTAFEPAVDVMMAVVPIQAASALVALWSIVREPFAVAEAIAEDGL